VTFAKWGDAYLSRTTGNTYRPLTDVEWEHAARGSTTMPFSKWRSIVTDQAKFCGEATYARRAKGPCLFTSSHGRRTVIAQKPAGFAVVTHREFIYVKASDGMPDVGCFRLVEAPMPKPADDQVLAHTHFLSRMKDWHSGMAASTAPLLLSAPVVSPSRLPSQRAPYARLRDRHPRRTTVARHLSSAPAHRR
jgi:hypothetical protein